MVAKSLPKWSPDPPPRHRKLELSQNCKSNKNHCIYYCFEHIQTSHPGAMSTPKSLQNQFWNPHCNLVVHITKKSSTCLQSWSQGAAKIHQKSSKMTSGPQGVLLDVFVDFRIIKMLTRDTQMLPPGYQNDKLFNTMGNLRVGGMRRQPGKFQFISN